MGDTGISQEQYDYILKFFWPEDDDFDGDAFLEGLKTPEELHQLAWNWNWDDGNDVPMWIISQPFCDRGTALLLYWHAGPGFFCQYSNPNEISKYQIKGYHFVREVEKRYLSGFYTHQTIAYDPTNDDSLDLTQIDAEYGAKQKLPAIMQEASPGRVLERAAF